MRALLAVVAAVLLAGCGESTETVTVTSTVTQTVTETAAGDATALPDAVEETRRGLLEAAQSALDWVTTRDETAPDGAALVFTPSTVRLLAPIPRPPLIRDFMAFETHLKNIYPKLGREIPPQWYEMPVYYKGNPSAVGGNGDVIDMPPYATNMDFEFEFAAVIGKGASWMRSEPTEVRSSLWSPWRAGTSWVTSCSVRSTSARRRALGLVRWRCDRIFSGSGSAAGW